MDKLQKGDKIVGKTIEKSPAVITGEIITILDKTVIISTADQGNVLIKKSDLTVINK